MGRTEPPGVGTDANGVPVEVLSRYKPTRLRRWLRVIQVRLTIDTDSYSVVAKRLGVSVATVGKDIRNADYRRLEGEAQAEFMAHATRLVARRAAEVVVGPKAVEKDVGAGGDSILDQLLAAEGRLVPASVEGAE